MAIEIGYSRAGRDVVAGRADATGQPMQAQFVPAASLRHDGQAFPGCIDYDGKPGRVDIGAKRAATGGDQRKEGLRLIPDEPRLKADRKGEVVGALKPAKWNDGVGAGRRWLSHRSVPALEMGRNRTHVDTRTDRVRIGRIDPNQIGEIVSAEMAGDLHIDRLACTDGQSVGIAS
ncbi:hypothetical protein [Mesorhizobium sp. B4-1-4]|uniref:hypothetical protein n=1 Tax=Mesorhizobium sp. B4-1-4 TaxID=2589888 RepID=UPI001D01FB27|nr:hypothetical protein [Mesorhizobium sp. B4-1-4]UCI34641.1 hypothetical protein FJW03_15010 [Mesorhizobium sp. B4-1-4]